MHACTVCPILKHFNRKNSRTKGPFTWKEGDPTRMFYKKEFKFI